MWVVAEGTPKGSEAARRSVKWFWFLAGLIVAFGAVNIVLEIVILTG